MDKRTIVTTSLREGAAGNKGSFTFHWLIIRIDLHVEKKLSP